MTAGSLRHDLLTKPARALTVLGALQNHEEGQRKVKLMPTWVNLSQGGSTLHLPEATEEKGSTTSAGVRGKDPQPVVSGRRAKNLAEILSSYKKTKKPKKRPRAKPAAKQPPKKKAKLLPGESSESEEFEETGEDEEGEPPSGDDDDEDETQETQIPEPIGTAVAMTSPPTRGPVGSVERSADFELAPLANGDTQRHPAAEDQTGPCRYNLLGPCRLQVCRVAFCGGVLCCGPKLRNGGGVQKRGGSGVGNRWRASSKCQEEDSEGKEAKEEEEDANEEWWQAKRRRCRRGRKRGYGKKRRGCSTGVRQ